jgi:hypothetical protein
MNETNKDQITPLKNTEDYEKLKEKYELEKKQLKDEAEKWKNTAIKRDDLLLEKDKALDRLTEERDDWKREAHSARRVQQETKQHKEQTDFLTEFQRLQEKKGLKWDESQEKWININK